MPADGEWVVWRPSIRIQTGSFRVWISVCGLGLLSVCGLRTSRIVGAEALIRWQTRDGGLLSPIEFLPIAERTGLIRTITTWVLETACMQTRRWCDRELDLFVSINLPSAFWHPAGLRRALTASRPSG